MLGIRIGHGFDVHAFEPSGQLVLASVKIDHPFGLKAHSDGDVVLHAVADALLGAAGLGDIGLHFPDTDPKWRGVASSLLLQQVLSSVNATGFHPLNLDVTIIAQTPKLNTYREAMRANLARLLQVEINAVNLKATTTEKLGYIGRSEGIATHAVVLLGCNAKCSNK